MTLERKQRYQSKQIHQPLSDSSQTSPIQVDIEQKKRIEAQQAMRPLLNTSVMVQRRTVSPLLQAISLQREEEYYLGTEQQSLQRKIDNLGELPKGAVQEAIQRQLESKTPVPRVTQLKTPADWVTIMRQKAAEVDGQRISEREAMKLNSLQCQVADAINQGYRRNRQTSEARNAEYGGMLASLHDHPRSQRVSNAVLGMVPKSDQPKLQRALDEALQRKQDLVAQDQIALQVHALQRKQAKLKEEENKPIAERIQARKGSGSPLPEHIQKHLEQGLNYDLSKVRIHEDAEADKMAKSVNAVAFTSGTDIFFQSGKYKPNTKEGLELLAHEVTHAVQQNKGQVAKGIDPDAGLEQEAQAMGKQLSQVMPNPKSIMPPVPHKTGAYAPDVYSKEAAVQRSQAGAAQYFSLKPLYDLQPKSVQRMARGDFTAQRWDLGLGAVWDATGGKVVNAVANGAKALASKVLTVIPGYDILCKVFGKDLVTGEKLEGGATSILETLSDWVPGPLKDIIKALKESNAIGKAWDWFKKKLAGLDFGGLLSDIGEGLKSGRFGKAKDAVSKRISGLKELILGSAEKIAEIGIIAISAGLGPAGKELMTKLAKSKGVVIQVLQEPGKFVGHLLDAVKGGFNQFGANISKHLQNGIGSWLSGASGITFPEKFDLQGIFMTALTVMGLTYQYFRGKLVKSLGPGGEKKVNRAEKVVKFVKVMKTGLHKVKDMKSLKQNVGSALKKGIKGEVIKNVVTAGMTKLLTMLIPGAGFVQMIISAFKAVQFIIDQGKQIMEMMMGALSSIGAIAAGNIRSASGFIEKTLARGIPIALAFLSKVLGLGNMGRKVKRVIEKVRGRLDKWLNKMIRKIKVQIRKWTKKGKGKGKDKPQTDKDKAKDHDKKVAKGLKDIPKFEKRFSKKGKLPNKEAAKKVAQEIKKKHSIFKSVTPNFEKSSIVYDWVASKGSQKSNTKLEVLNYDINSMRKKFWGKKGRPSFDDARKKFKQEILKEKKEEAKARDFHNRHIIAFDSTVVSILSEFYGLPLCQAAQDLGLKNKNPKKEHILDALKKKLRNEFNEPYGTYLADKGDNSSLGGSIPHAKREINKALVSGDIKKAEEINKNYAKNSIDIPYNGKDVTTSKVVTEKNSNTNRNIKKRKKIEDSDQEIGHQEREAVSTIYGIDIDHKSLENMKRHISDVKTGKENANKEAVETWNKVRNYIKNARGAQKVLTKYVNFGSEEGKKKIGESLEKSVEKMNMLSYFIR